MLSPHTHHSNQSGTILMIIAVMFPIILYISYSSLERTQSELKTTANMLAYSELVQIADNSIERTIADGAQITDSINEVIASNPPYSWFPKTYTINDATATTEVQANKYDTQNTAPGLLNTYIVSIRSTVEKNGIVFESERHITKIGL